MQVIGKVKEFGYSDAPFMRDMISDCAHAKKSKIAAYLRNGKAVSACPAIWRDIFTGEKIEGEALMLSDGTYAWRSDVVYYFEKYNMSLPEEFVNFIFANN